MTHCYRSSYRLFTDLSALYLVEKLHRGHDVVQRHTEHLPRPMQAADPATAGNNRPHGRRCANGRHAR